MVSQGGEASSLASMDDREWEAATPGYRQVAVTATAEFFAIGVDDLLPESCVFDADAVVRARHRRKVEHDRDALAGVAAFAQKTEHAVLGTRVDRLAGHHDPSRSEQCPDAILNTHHVLNDLRVRLDQLS